MGTIWTSSSFKAASHWSCGPAGMLHQDTRARMKADLMGDSNKITNSGEHECAENLHKTSNSLTPVIILNTRIFGYMEEKAAIWRRQDTERGGGHSARLMFCTIIDQQKCRSSPAKLASGSPYGLKDEKFISGLMRRQLG
ncbi:hypothetical protein HPP92_028903 [Vanilla planifolia]|uniref:Uncharacterized protein n=1 Tax=Vanilla planifolia TaxID=51239 RepID=A0A835U4Y4_VANPL|nr:hypothetical protein HPP92_028903 [Vanilla planifolia]KAG0446306.1 hypothetical protein HPP92_028893 [Vanilla planifolia]